MAAQSARVDWWPMTTDAQFSPPCGPVQGWVEADVVRATGIPYARARRFEQPQPVEDWLAPYEATQPAPACPQTEVSDLDPVIGSQTGGLPQNEDCQNLSITMPSRRGGSEALPVMVWIHGGSYIAGAGDAPVYNPRALVSEQDVIVVSITYRLGLLGFLGGNERPANLGLLDQLAALKWIQRNIAAFGGDPRRVTVFGQSAGGDAVAHLMAVKNAHDLFCRAIIQSPPLGISRGREKMTEVMAESASEVSSHTPIEDVLTAQDAAKAAAARSGLKGIMPFGTQYGAAPLPQEQDIEAAWRAVAPRIDIMVTHTRHETRLFLPMVPATRKLRALPLIGERAATFVGWILTRKVYTTAIQSFAQRHRRAGGSAYEFTVRWAAPGNPYGAAHAIDVALLFGTPATTDGLGLLRGASWEEIDTQGRALRQHWARFARGENPIVEKSASGLSSPSPVGRGS